MINQNTQQIIDECDILIKKERSISWLINDATKQFKKTAEENKILFRVSNLYAPLKNIITIHSF